MANTFGTNVNPAHYIEVQDPVNPGQVKRPDAGVTVYVKRADTLEDLSPFTSQQFGYFDYVAPDDVTAILVRADGSDTWVGPLKSREQEASEQGAAAAAAAATAAVDGLADDVAAANTKAQQALDAAQSAGTGNANVVPILVGQPDPTPYVEGSLLVYYV